MKISRESLIHNQSPEYRHALQELIKFELQALVERLSATGEEALVLTASCPEGTSMQFGSQKAEGFLRKKSSLGQDFLSYCNDGIPQSSADELCNTGDELEDDEQKDDDLEKEAPKIRQYSPVRQREITTSKRLSFSENEVKDNIYEVSQNSDLSASERNDSISSVASFMEDNENTKVKSSLQCKICMKSFRSNRTLKQHLRLHMAKSYKCSVCGKIFTMKTSYQRHILSHNMQNTDKLFECGICVKTFTDLYSWKKHRECHLDVRNYSCNLCGKAFYEKYSLKVHQTSHFNPALKVDKNADLSSGYSCHICGKLSKTKTAMKNHMLTHSAKKHTCEFCNKRFLSKYSYVRHRRIHTGEKPYRCGACDRSFSDGSAWAKHIRTHSGIRPYSCDVCCKSFYDKTLCKTHMKRHKGRRWNKSFDIDNKRNFAIVQAKGELGVKDEIKPESKTQNTEINFEMQKHASSIYDEDINLRLEVSDKEELALLDPEFSTNLLPPDEITRTPVHMKSPENFPSLMESIGLDENFQTEFVERNMPIKPIESDNELIASVFNDSDILVEDTDVENQHSRQEKPEFTSVVSPAQLTDLSTQQLANLSSTKTHADMTETASRKPHHGMSYRKCHFGKFVPESPAKCKNCHKKFKKESILKQHLQFHCILKKLYKCRFCGKQLASKNSLIRHERIHIGDRPYMCYICQKTFADNYGCIRHINQHLSKDGKLKEGMKMGSHKEDHLHRVSDSHSSTAKNQKLLKTEFDEYPAENLIASDHSNVTVNTVVQTVPNVPVNQTAPNHTNMQVNTGQQNTTSNSSVSAGSIVQITSNSNIPMNAVKQNSPYHTMVPVNTMVQHTTSLFNVSTNSAAQKTPSNSNTCVLMPSKSQIMSPKKSVSVEDNVGHVVPGNAREVHFRSKIALVEKQERKHLYKCFQCPLLFTSEQECVQHIKQTHGNPDLKEHEDMKNLYQCSLCLQVYETEGACQNHINNECELSKVSTECAVQSILQESLLTSATASPDKTSNLNFPVVNDEHSFLNLLDSQVLLISNAAESNNTGSECMSDMHLQIQSTDNVNQSSFIPVGPKTSQGLQIQTDSQPQVNVTSNDTNFIGLNQRPVFSQGTGTFLLSAGSTALGFIGTSNIDMQGTTKRRRSNTATDVSQRTCNICSKVFVNKHILKQHMLIHMERKFGCKFCMKKFHNKYGRDRHERIHTGEKPFTCPSCKMSFGDNSTYKKHTRVCCSGI